MKGLVELVIQSYELQYRYVTGRKYVLNRIDSNMRQISTCVDLLNTAYKQKINIDIIRGYVEFALGLNYNRNSYQATRHEKANPWVCVIPTKKDHKTKGFKNRPDCLNYVKTKNLKGVRIMKRDSYKVQYKKTDINKFFVNLVFSKTTVERYLSSPTRYKYGMKRRLQNKAKGEIIDYTEVKDTPEENERNQLHRKMVTGLNNYEEADKALFHNTPKGYIFCDMETTIFHPKSTLCQTCKFALKCQQKLLLMYPTIYLLRGLPV